MSGVMPTRVGGVDAGTFREQLADDVHGPLPRGRHDERRSAHLGDGVDVGPGIEEPACLGGIHGRQMQGGDAAVAHGADVGLAVEQDADALAAAERCRQHQRRLPLRVLRLHPPIAHQRTKRGEVVLTNGAVEAIVGGRGLCGCGHAEEQHGHGWNDAHVPPRLLKVHRY